MKNKQSIAFIAINILVAFLGFVRSFAFMKFFNFNELGVITLVNTSAALIGLFQIGLINGGYRIIALREADSNNKVNNVIFSYFGALFIGLLVVSLGAYFFGFFTDLLVISVTVLIGFFMLVTNWLTNTLIGAQEYIKLNLANGISALASLVCLILAYYFGLYGALFSLLIQPCLFVIIVLFTFKDAIPKKIDLDFIYIKYILRFGFIPFLSGIFALFYMQIERWSITVFLGTNELGKLYIVFLIITLWSLLPASINSLYFPRGITAMKNKNFVDLFKIIKQYFIVIFLYSALGCISILVLINPIVKHIFPAHLPYIHLVYILIPGLLLKNFSDPICLMLNIVVKLKPIFYSDLLSITLYAILVFLLKIFNVISLETMLISYVIYNLVRFVYLIICFYQTKEKIIEQEYAL